MTARRNVNDLFDEARPDLAPVASVEHPWVCPGCLGPKGEPWPWCPGCRDLQRRGASAELLRSTVPVSIARRPGRWYNVLATYKAGHPEHRLPLMAVLWTFLATHMPRINAALGGELSMITTVPSKRGRSFEEHPLRQALSLLRPVEDILRPVLTYQRDPAVRDLRKNYYPQCFHRDGESPDGQRMLLIEDTWVTGATAVSAAGALLDQGARSVLTLPIARVLDLDFWSARGSPYVDLVDGDEARRYEADRWPREPSG